MSFMEMLFLGGVIAAFVSFAAALAWVAHVEGKDQPRQVPAGED